MRKVGFTASSFDVLHAGHILMLKWAKENCDYLIVALQTDPTIDRPEKNKPVQSFMERYLQLQAIRYVDEIVLYETESDLMILLQNLPITHRFLDESYKEKEYTGKGLSGIEILYNPRKHDYSSTNLRKRIRDAGD